MSLDELMKITFLFKGFKKQKEKKIYKPIKLHIPPLFHYSYIKLVSSDGINETLEEFKQYQLGMSEKEKEDATIIEDVNMEDSSKESAV
ncbi:hypothetical protein SUGI_0199810 [Cryptomeria japonica]|nr:hypothetical protein SUGI_0199810 [Cryptomeria japonica]